MTKTYTIPCVQNANNLTVQLSNATGAGTKVVAWTAGANDSVLKSFGVTSTDTAAQVLQVWINIGGAGTDILAGSVTVAAGAGNDGVTTAVDVMRSTLIPWLSYDSNGNHVFNAKAATTVKVSTVAVVTSGKNVNCIGEGGDF